MDPRGKITPEVQQIFTLTARVESAAQNALRARTDARAFIDKLKARPQSASNTALIQKLEEIAPADMPPPATDAGPRGDAAPAAPAAPNLTNIAGRLIGSVMSMQAAEISPTAAELTACAAQESAYSALMAKWAALKAGVQ
jgi:hypothetical protein